MFHDRQLHEQLEHAATCDRFAPDAIVFTLPSGLKVTLAPILDDSSYSTILENGLTFTRRRVTCSGCQASAYEETYHRRRRLPRWWPGHCVEVARERRTQRALKHLARRARRRARHAR